MEGWVMLCRGDGKLGGRGSAALDVSGEEIAVRVSCSFAEGVGVEGGSCVGSLWRSFGLG